MISVGRILEGAFGLIRDQFAAVAIWAGIYLAGSIAMLLAAAPVMRQAMNPAAIADPTQMISAMAPVWLLNLLMMVVGIILYTAAMRAVLRPQAGGVGFLRVGMDELRMLVLLILFAILGTILGVGFVFILGLFGAGVAMSSESVALTILLGTVVGFTVFILFIFLLIRFSLAFPLTLHRRRIVIGEAWSLSRGRFWTLFGAALVVTVIGMVLSMVIASFAMGSYFADMMAVAGNPDAAAAVAERQMTAAGSLSAMMIVQSLAGSAIGAIWIALSGGSAATATKLLLEAEFDDAEEVFG